MPSAISLSLQSVSIILVSLDFLRFVGGLGFLVINNLKDNMSRLLLARAIEKAPNRRANMELYISGRNPLRISDSEGFL